MEEGRVHQGAGRILPAANVGPRGLGGFQIQSLGQDGCRTVQQNAEQENKAESILD
jgi:hypothetical protein